MLAEGEELGRCSGREVLYVRDTILQFIGNRQVPCKRLKCGSEAKSETCYSICKLAREID